MNVTETMRLDKWLWCALYKTRSLATEEISKGRVTVNGQQAKPARDLRCGDTVALRQGPVARTVLVRALSGAGALPLWPSCCTKRRQKASRPASRRQNKGAWRPSPPPPCKTGAPPNATGATSSVRRTGAAAGAHPSTSERPASRRSKQLQHPRTCSKPPDTLAPHGFY